MIPAAFFRKLLEGQTARRWRLALCTAHQEATFDSAREAVGEGYPAGGLEIPAPLLEEEGRKIFLLWPRPVTFQAPTTVTASHCAIYDTETGAVIVSLEFARSQASQNGAFIVTIPRDAFVVRV